jgi:soluble lytic murein transglycosylase-like protein
MRSTSVALAVAVAATWTGAHCAEMPDGSNATAAIRTDVSTARPNPHSRSKIVVSDPGAGLAFIAEGDIPVPVLKPPPARRQPPPETICGLIRSAARQHDIPARFLTRLIWQESRFRVTAVSHAGAQGIAQFMPATAAERDLEDPFDPRQAVAAAASLLSSLERRFGNLGLAAAAYNAGPGRVSAWLRQAQAPAGRDAPLRQGDHRPPGEQLGQGEEEGPEHRRQGRGRDNLRVHRRRHGGLSRPHLPWPPHLS